MMKRVDRTPHTSHTTGQGRDERFSDRVRSADVEWAAERLSARDRQIVETINRLRLVSASQLERVHFLSLTGHTREVVRGRVLRRLVRWRVLNVLSRRIGGAPRGSAGSVFTLGPVGLRLWREQQAAAGALSVRVRRSDVPTERTIQHALAVSALYADLVEQARAHGAHLLAFEGEPACWWPNGLGGYVKPDAYTTLALDGIYEHWWIEVDRATESVPTLRRKLITYLDFVVRGQEGPQEVVPRVLITAPTAKRRDVVSNLVGRLQPPAGALFLVSTHTAAASVMLRSLHE